MSPNDQIVENVSIEANGKIIHLEMPYKDTEGNNKGGYGFISSPDVPLVRIFFHWTSMVHNTTPFTELQKDMKVSFLASKYFDKDGKYQGYRAFKVRVITDAESKRFNN